MPEVQYGDILAPAVSPEWKHVKKQTLDLLARTRDPVLHPAKAPNGSLF
ncbi:hypothetical protein NX784_05910 [Massilia pinisoli]|uniref:Uncharacterized protein n=1 Tax=Massilia pinisoli TaxID=1772194 RepID=A0ABT1ZMK3_9BURK|nr:hypothetical protein [Massilia pinisoli]MCS0581120.1 hypothetical protein [Massilia pinisoli]